MKKLEYAGHHLYKVDDYDKWKIIKKLKRKINLNPVEIFSFSKNFFSTEDTRSFYDQLKTDLTNLPKIKDVYII